MATPTYPIPVVTNDNSPKRFSFITAWGTAAILVSAKPGRLYQGTFVNTSAVAMFIQIHDKATAAIAGDVPIWVRRVAASSELFMNLDPYGLFCANGISCVVSTTVATATFSISDCISACGWFTSNT